jgi:hypothetical protein
MPIALDPSKTFDLVLKSDEGKYPPPTFTFRYINGREWIGLAETLDGIQGANSGGKALRAIYDALRVPLVGWSNMGDHDFAPADLDLILNPGEAKELFEKVMANIQPGDAEKKS